MTSRRRRLMLMAGLIDTPQERLMKRMARRQQYLNRQMKRDLELIDMIGRREKGDQQLKPMPYAPAKTE